MLTKVKSVIIIFFNMYEVFGLLMNSENIILYKNYKFSVLVPYFLWV